MRWFIGGGLAYSIAAAVIFAFCFGAVFGASIHASPGQSKSEEIAKLSTVEERVTEDVRENATGWLGQVRINIASTVGAWAEIAAIHGVNFGYNHPALAPPLAKAAPILVLVGGLFGMLYRLRGLIYG